MENYLSAAGINLRRHMIWHMALGILFLAAAPLLMGLSNLDAVQSAQVLEMYALLAGIILLVPIFFPENDKNVRELTASKYMSETKVWLIRLAQNMLLLMLAYLAFIFIMKNQGCSLNAWEAWAGTIAGAVFLGGIGILGYSLTDNVVIGYMIPMIYYIANFSGNKYLGKLYLFSMMRESMEEKIWLAAGGVLCIVAGITFRSIRK